MTADSLPWLKPPSSRAAWLALAVVLAATALVRGRLLEVPLERDEGEYAYAGQLLLQGVPPYQAAYNMKFPGTYAAYAVLMAGFGQTTAGVHLGLLLVNEITIVLLFLLGRRLFGPDGGVAAAATFALMAVSQGVLGFAAHATHFVTLFAVAGALALHLASERHRAGWYFVSGLMFGTALLMKQHGAVFSTFGFAYAAWAERFAGRRTLIGRVGAFTVGAILPFLTVCVALAAAGVFDKFRFWTFDYAREYASRMPLSAGWALLQFHALKVATPTWPLWGVALVGLVLMFRRSPRSKGAFVAGFLAASFLATCPGLYFREHYFVVLLPAVALLAGAVVGLEPPSGRPLLTVAFAVAFAWSVWDQANYLFFNSPLKVSRDNYGSNPFPESMEIAERIRKDTTPEDRIAVIGSEPQIYFHAKRRSATGYIYVYPLMEPQPFAETMQREMIAEIEAAHPKYVVVILAQASWLMRPDAPKILTEWADNYCREHYRMVALYEMSLDGNRSVWGDDVTGYRPQQSPLLAIYRRLD